MVTNTSSVLRALPLSLFLLSPLGAQADESASVTLQFNDGDTLSGVLLDQSETEYQLQTSVGTILVPSADVECIGAACPDSTTVTSNVGGEVRLETLDGSSVIFGQLLELTASEFVVSTAIGDLRVDRSTVTCRGDGCPKATLPGIGQTVTMVGQGVRVEGVLADYNPHYFVVTTPTFGDVNFSSLEFSCEGQGCPN